MTDHYELLGVDPAATKDEIKAAYRSEVEGADSSRRAQLNRAWNVLSDPIQRQRYDEQLGEGDGGGSDGGGGGAVVLPASRATGARRGPDSTALEANGSSSNGSGKNGSGGGGSGGGGGGGGGGGDDGSDDDVPMRGGRPIPQPTVVLPAGMNLATKRQRGMSILFDLSIVALIVLACQFLVPPLVSSDYQKNRDAYDAQIERASDAQEREDRADDRREDATADAKRAARNDNPEAEQAALDRASKARADARSAENEREAATDEANRIGSDELQIPGFIALAVALVVSLLYCVPVSAITGQTFGKRMRKLWLVRQDGSRVGWGGSLIHFGVPILLTLALLNIAGLFAVLLGFGMVFWALRDRNEQGLHDKIARTLVVDSPPASS